MLQVTKISEDNVPILFGKLFRILNSLTLLNALSFQQSPVFNAMSDAKAGASATVKFSLLVPNLVDFCSLCLLKQRTSICQHT